MAKPKTPNTARFKYCCGCKVEHPVSAFAKASARKDGLQTACRGWLSAYKKLHYDGPHAVAKSRKWRQKHPEAYARHVKESKARNREHYNDLSRVRCARRRARKKVVFVEDVHPLVVLELHDGICGICGKDVDPFNYEVDHIIPLAKNGEHSYANSQLAHPICNRRKGDRVD